jgi:cysteinyl-tRNA synthetase
MFRLLVSRQQLPRRNLLALLCRQPRSACGRALHIYNSLSRRLEPVPRPSDGILTLYVCGPTVYSQAHLGHARTYVLFDAMARVLRQVFGYTVVSAMNITDVDDKIISRAKALQTTRQAVAEQSELEFWRDMEALGVLRPTCAPRATEFIAEMQSFALRLVEGGLAYLAPDGSVYMDTRVAAAAVGYPGPLAPGRALAAAAQEQVGGKRSADDFCLWKASGPEEDGWDAPAALGGRGRPGWHLECSAMVEATVGRVRSDGRVDVHGGGVDLCFPHHANERAQSQACLALGGDARPWAGFFVHTGHVLAGQEKMAKSLGNFVTLAQARAELSPRACRLLFLSSARYPSSTEWTPGSVGRARALDEMLDSLFATRVQSFAKRRQDLSERDVQVLQTVARARGEMGVALADDFDFPRVFRALQGMIREVRAYESGALAPGGVAAPLPGVVAAAQEVAEWILNVLGFGARGGCQGYGGGSSNNSGHENAGKAGSEEMDQLIDVLVQFRNQVRTGARAKQLGQVLQACDELRDVHFAKLGVLVEDGADGSSRWRRRQ